MKNLKHAVILVAATVMVLSSCKKDNPKPDDNGNTKTCLAMNIKDSNSFDLKMTYANNLLSKLEQFYFNEPAGWELDATLEFEYNSNKQITKFANRQSTYKEIMELVYTNNRVSSFDVYDSSETGEKEYSYTVNYEYNSDGKISKWTAIDKSDPSTPFAQLSLSYDANGGIREIILAEPNMDGVMTPGAKYVLTNDNQKLINPYFPSLLMEGELFYLLFLQDNMKQPNKIEAFTFNEADETWVLESGNMLQNTYDADGKLTKMVIENETYNVTWDCK